MRNTMTQRMRRGVAAGAVLAVLVGGGVATAGAADAAHLDGTLQSGEFGLYYSPNQAGPVFDLLTSDSDFSNNDFPNTGTHANDNTASYRNRDSVTWFVYTARNAGGSEGWIDPGVSSNASATFRNKISSAYWYDAN
jgi:peptidase inhibitor family I36